MIAGLQKRHWYGMLLLLILGAHYTLFNVANPLNRHGHGMPEWPLLVDLLVTLPLLDYLLCRPAPKAWLLKYAALLSLGILFGSYAIPADGKVLWPALEQGRNVLAILFALGEVAFLAYLAVQIRAMLRRSGEIDAILARTLGARIGNPALLRLMLFEARVWYYGLFMRDGARLRYAGTRHFGYANNQGNASNQLGWIMAMLFEMPLLHLLLHFLVTPTAALIVTGLTAWSMLYLVADYRASHYRPVSLDADGARLLLRCGALAADTTLPLAMLAGAARCSDAVPRQRGVRRYRQMGSLNVALSLREGSQLPDCFGRPRAVSRICLSLDDPDAFLAALHGAGVPADGAK